MSDGRRRMRLERLVGEAIGEASMQWRPIPWGAFDACGAAALAERVVAALRIELELRAMTRRLLVVAHVTCFLMGFLLGWLAR